LSNTQQASPQEITYQWLRYSKDDYTSVQNGTAPFSSQGGQAAARFNWDVDTPRNPFWCWAIAFQFRLTVTLSIPAGGTVTLSPFAPYSGIGVQLTIGGGQAIQPMSLVPFWLDELTSRRDNDWTQYAPGMVADPAWGPAAGQGALVPGVPASLSFLPQWAWDGSDYTGGTNGVIQPLAITDQAGAKYYPGQVIPNSGGTTLNLTMTFRFQAWMQLGRKLYGRNLEDLTGCIPMGDPANRPTLYVNVASLIGTFPEQNMFVSNAAGALAASAITHATTPSTCQVIWVCKQLDQLPDNVSVGTPKVLSALEVNTNGGFSVQNAGQFVNLIFDTAMVYNKRFHVVVNNQLPVSADYFGIWYSENQSNARFFWDGTLNNLQEYFRMIRQVYGRNMPQGVYVADLVGGRFPEFPRETPYRGEIVTSTTLAGLTGLKPYPNAQTTLRYQAGSPMSSAYVNTYSFGTVPVSY
jgi:hypothetical protein